MHITQITMRGLRLGALAVYILFLAGAEALAQVPQIRKREPVPVRIDPLKRPGIEPRSTVFEINFNATATSLDWRNAYLLMYLSNMVYVEQLARLVGEPAPVDSNDPCSSEWPASSLAYRMHVDSDLFEQRFVEAATARRLFPTNTRYTMVSGTGKIVGKDLEGYDPEAMVISTPDAHLVVFRGTDRVGDDSSSKTWDIGEWIVTNFQLGARPASINYGDLSGLRHTYVVHSGFDLSLDVIRNRLWEALQADDPDRRKPIWVTGHSLGGCHAQLFAAWIATKGRRAQGLYTYASPHVGGEDFVRTRLNAPYYNDISPESSAFQRFEFSEDPAPMYPTRHLNVARGGSRNHFLDLDTVVVAADERSILDETAAAASLLGIPIVEAMDLTDSTLDLHIAEPANFCFHHQAWYLEALWRRLDTSRRQSILTSTSDAGHGTFVHADGRSFYAPPEPGDCGCDATTVSAGHDRQAHILALYDRDRELMHEVVDAIIGRLPDLPGVSAREKRFLALVNIWAGALGNRITGFSERVGAEIGSWLGEEIGVKAGGGLGTSVAGPQGGAIGGALGGKLGATIGEKIGEKIGEDAARAAIVAAVATTIPYAHYIHDHHPYTSRTSRAGTFESLFLHLVDSAFTDDAIAFAQQWKNLPGLTDSMRSTLEQYSFLRPSFETVSYIKRYQRLEASARPARPESTWFSIATKIVREDPEGWASVLALGEFDLEVEDGTMRLETPPLLRAAGASSLITRSLPEVSRKVVGPSIPFTRPPYIDTTFKLGDFRVQWGPISVVESGQYKDKIRAQYSIARDSMVASAEINYVLRSSTRSRQSLPKRLDIPLGIQLPMKHTGALYFEIDEMKLRFDSKTTIAVALGNLDFRADGALAVLNSLLERLDRPDDGSPSIPAILGNSLRELAWSTIFDDVDDSFAQMLQVEAMQRAAALSIDNPESLVDARLSDGKLRLTFRHRQWQLPEIPALPRAQLDDALRAAGVDLGKTSPAPVATLPPKKPSNPIQPSLVRTDRKSPPVSGTSGKRPVAGAFGTRPSPFGSRQSSTKKREITIYWSPSWSDHFGAVTETAEGAAKEPHARYRQLRIEGSVLEKRELGAIPLHRYWHSGRRDYCLAARGGSQLVGTGYTVVGPTEGYVYATRRAGTVPLKRYFHPRRRDHVCAVSSDFEQQLRRAGYAFVQTEGYVYPR